jgi:preprotein translocase subunit SecD
MSKRFRLFIVLLVLVVCGSFLFPTVKWYFFTPVEKKELASRSREQIRLISRNQAGEALAELRESAVNGEALREDYKFLVKKAKENYKLAEMKVPETWDAAAVLKAFKSERELYSELETKYRNDILKLKSFKGDILQMGLDLSGGMSVLLKSDMESLKNRLGKEPSAADKADTMKQALEILNNRIDKFGVTEPQIRIQGEDSILIEIPGDADPERVQSFLMGRGSLAFHIVDDEGTSRLNDYLRQNPVNPFNAAGQPNEPEVLGPGLVARGFYVKDNYGIDQLTKYMVVREEKGLDGIHLEEASVGSDPITGAPVIDFKLDREGGEIFFKLTSSNTGKTLAILMDEKIKAGARISEPIRDMVRMSGFDRKEASDLAIVLRTASMPIELEVETQQAVGAALGEDSIRTGLRAMLLGFILVVVFMLVYYKAAGLAAILALVLNFFFLIGILSAMNFTLTMTSIAGIILTLGMAVDSNVIIFERIKEEYHLGKSPEASVQAGFKKAFWTIMDSQVTTFIAAVFLSMISSGPIQGFAYTLAIGIVSSVFTALFISRLVFDFSLDVFKIKSLSISWRK